MIRISGGKHRSRKLLTPDTSLTKPTMDKVREGVFSALSFDISNKKILDLFAGSGSYGFEAISRGASHVTFVDKQMEAINIIKANAESLKETNIKTVKDDVINFLENCDDKFDIVFFDPPYKLEIYEKVLEMLNKGKILNKNAIIVAESEKEIQINELDYKKIKMYNYGLAKVYILRK